MDLRKLLNPQGFGTAYFSLRDEHPSDYGDRDERRAFAIQVTDLGITTRVAYNKVLVWVHRLSGGQAVEGATGDLGADSETPTAIRVPWRSSKTCSSDGCRNPSSSWKVVKPCG